MICIYLRSRPRRRHRSLVYRLDAARAVWRPQGWSRKAPPPRRHLPHFFAGQALGGNRSSGWFFGFQRPGVFTHRGLWLNAALIPDNVALSPPVSGLVGDRVGRLVADGGSLFCERGNQRQGLLALPLRPKRGIQREKATPAQSRPAPAARRVFSEIRIDPRQNSAPIDPSRSRSRPLILGRSVEKACFFPAKGDVPRPNIRVKSPTQWTKVEPLLPKPPRCPRGRRRVPDRGL